MQRCPQAEDFNSYLDLLQRIEKMEKKFAREHNHFTARAVRQFFGIFEDCSVKKNFGKIKARFNENLGEESEGERVE
uniref:Uncharacterized protein n=1 Tax=Caenorhabditis japonica TaxID=281687 RepID=A0A8R1IG13_CAEJA